MVPIERIEPGTEEWSKYYPNHIMRYEFAKNIIHNNKNHFILDAACGVGYGTEYLSKEVAGKFIGVDISDHALKIANDKFASSSLSFVKDNCEELKNLPPDQLFSAIISFETFEHLRQPTKFLQRAYDLLEDGGQLIVSTPNRYISSPGDSVNWEFHENEYTPCQFFEYFKKLNFQTILVYGQQYTNIGNLRKEIRQEIKQLLQVISFNPFYRLGNFLKTITGRKMRRLDFLEQEYINDFEIVLYKDIEEMEKLNSNGPFVQIVIATK